jgi:hypothetical protein
MFLTKSKLIGTWLIDKDDDDIPNFGDHLNLSPLLKNGATFPAFDGTKKTRWFQNTGTLNTMRLNFSNILQWSAYSSL